MEKNSRSSSPTSSFNKWGAKAPGGYLLVAGPGVLRLKTGAFSWVIRLTEIFFCWKCVSLCMILAFKPVLIHHEVKWKFTWIFNINHDTWKQFHVPASSPGLWLHTLLPCQGVFGAESETRSSPKLNQEFRQHRRHTGTLRGPQGPRVSGHAMTMIECRAHGYQGGSSGYTAGKTKIKGYSFCKTGCKVVS